MALCWWDHRGLMVEVLLYVFRLTSALAPPPHPVTLGLTPKTLYFHDYREVFKQRFSST